MLVLESSCVHERGGDSVSRFSCDAAGSLVEVASTSSGSSYIGEKFVSSCEEGKTGSGDPTQAKTSCSTARPS